MTKKNRKTNENDTAKIVYKILGNLVWVVLFYVWVTYSFKESIICEKNASKAQCECIKQVFSRNVPFFDKVIMSFKGASKEELNAYATPLDNLSCNLRLF